MKTFAYRGFGADGLVRKGLVEAATPKAAREQLARQGVLADRLHPVSRSRSGLSAVRRGVFYRELAALLSAGIPLVNALGMLLRNPERTRRDGVWLAAVRDQVREGGALAAALKTVAAGISPFEAATIDVAERSASLESVLDQLADFMESRERLRERLQRALIYPALVLALGITVAMVMMGLLLPRTRQLIGASADLPGLTRMVLAFADGMFPWGLLLFGVGCLLALSYGRGMRTDADRRVAMDRRLCALPLLGNALRHMISARFARTLGILARSGIPLVEGVPLAGRATGNAWCEQLAVSASQSIRHGQTLEAAVRAIPPLNGDLPEWISIGEAGGDLAGMLDHAAERAEQAFDHVMANAMALLEPALLMIIGSFVLLITLAVMLPVFSLTDAILR